MQLLALTMLKKLPFMPAPAGPGGATISYLHMFISNPPAKFLLLV